MESLDDIRRDLDAIDDELHALIMRRTGIMHRVAAAKARENGGAVGFAVRPGREAQMMRRLLAAHEGELPFPVIYRIWKELINGQTRVQTNLDLGVAENSADPMGLLDLARDQFASNTPLRRFADDAALIDAVANETCLAGVLDARVSGWWQSLAKARETNQAAPYIIVALPFVCEANAAPKAYAIGPAAPEPSGDDFTFAVAPPEASGSFTALDETAAGSFVMLDGFHDPVSLSAELPGAIYMGASAKPLVIAD
ncbi:MAG: chorismate mutase [Alphaproteobacteria bacterium]